ncbi:MAG: hypothetical protein R3E89_06435 [Thiolinea sp.]
MSGSRGGVSSAIFTRGKVSRVLPGMLEAAFDIGWKNPPSCMPRI